MVRAIYNNRIKIIESKGKMSHSPKIVKVDLLKQLQKTRTSPNKKSLESSQKLTKQFSFSNDLQTDRHYPKQSPKQLRPSPLAKKLFKESNTKDKINQNSKPKVSPAKQNIDKKRQKYIDYNLNYEQVDQQDRFFKKSIDKLKTSFFKNDGVSKETTKKILKEIGKYAENRSKSKQKKQNFYINPKDSKYLNIPIQLYGFKTKDEKITKTKRQRQSVQKGTFLDFERAYELTIADNNKKINNINYKSQSVRYRAIQQKLSQERQIQVKNNSEVYQYSETEQIQEKEINIVCQIFQLCDKLDESDTLTHSNLSQLSQELQIRYFLKKQQSRQNQKPTFQSIRFNNLISDFLDNLKVIFYRKQRNNIYDTLFYLRQTNHLQLVCQDFIKIKKMLQL